MSEQENTAQKFDRAYRIVIGESGERGVEIKSEIGKNSLNIEFDIRKTKDKTPNRSLLRIYNLSEATIEKVSRQDLAVFLYAGYERDGGALLMSAGTITYAQTYLQGGDEVTEIEFQDGFAQIRDSVISVSFQAGTSTKTMLETVARQTGCHLIMSQDITFKSFVTGFSFYGACRTALDKICAENGLEWSIQNSNLQIVKVGGTTQRKAFVIRAGTGMLESPRRIKEAAEDKQIIDKKSFTDDATPKSRHQKLSSLEVQSLLAPTILPADIIKLDSRHESGWYRVEEISHAGAYQGGDWISTMKISKIEAKDEETRW